MKIAAASRPIASSASQPRRFRAPAFQEVTRPEGFDGEDRVVGRALQDQPLPLLRRGKPGVGFGQRRRALGDLAVQCVVGPLQRGVGLPEFLGENLHLLERGAQGFRLGFGIVRRRGRPSSAGRIMAWAVATASSRARRRASTSRNWLVRRNSSAWLGIALGSQRRGFRPRVFQGDPHLFELVLRPPQPDRRPAPPPPRSFAGAAFQHAVAVANRLRGDKAQAPEFLSAPVGCGGNSPTGSAPVCYAFGTDRNDDRSPWRTKTPSSPTCGS